MAGVAVTVFVRDGVVIGVKAEVPLDLVVVDYDNIEAGDPMPAEYDYDFKQRLIHDVY